jgi:uncharacterized repeat protein (TIGR01451 family)
MKQVLIALTISLLTALAYAVFSSNQVAAQCTNFYGYGQACPSTVITVSKTVWNPTTGAFVKNLGVGDPKYQAEQVVTFQLTVANTRNSAIPQVIVRDTFPQFTSFISGPGNFDNTSKVLTFEVTSLAPGESRTFTVQGKVLPENQLPANMGIVCPVNQVGVTTNEGQSASDTAQFCIEKRVLGAQVPSLVTQIPATGVQPIYLLAFAPTALAGFFLRKRSFISH